MRSSPVVTKPVRVLIVEDHPVFRGVVRLACEHSDGRLEVAGEVADGRSALEVCRAEPPDVMVLDLSLPEMDGLEVVRLLRSEGWDIRILVLTAHSDREALFESIRAGVDGYLEKTEGVAVLVDAIQRVAAGERVFTPQQERAARAELARLAKQTREATEARSAVTERQLEILGLLAEGATTKQIARRLGVSPRTVESHLSTLYRRLGVENRVQAVSRAAELGLIDLDPDAPPAPSD